MNVVNGYKAKGATIGWSPIPHVFNKVLRTINHRTTLDRHSPRTLKSSTGENKCLGS